MIRFKSKRNRVIKLYGTVHKQVKSAEAAEFEANQIGCLKNAGMNVPSIKSVSGRTLKMDYITGVTLTDYIESLESLQVSDKQIEELANSICEWFDSYYKAVDWENSGQIHADVNCRNFIVSPTGEIYGIDFEELKFGSRESNIAEICAYITTYNPQNTVLKHKLCEYIINISADIMGLSKEHIINMLEKSLQDTYERRKKFSIGAEKL